MKTKSAKRLIAAAIIAAVLTTAFILRRPSVPEYEIIDLGFCGKSGRVSAINNAGQVVGCCYYSGSPARDIAFVWDAVNGRNDLQTPEGKGSCANDINDKGQIIGCFETREFLFWKPHEGWCLWDPKRGAIDMDSIAQSKTSLQWVANINNKGQIVAIQPSKSGQDHIIILSPKAKQ
jgi:uncharacterized membrane protein